MAITITKPIVGQNEDQWGTILNTALDTVVDAINGTAGTVAPDHTVLTLNGTDVTSTAAELNILDGVTATAAELNIMDGDTAASTVNILGTDKVIINDGGVMKQITVDALNTYVQGQAASGAFVPSGAIMMWSGATSNIPSGFVLCDGTNSTPDLRDRFVVGAGSSYAVGATGGNSSTTLSSANLPAHSHSFSGSTSTASLTGSANNIGEPFGGFGTANGVFSKGSSSSGGTPQNTDVSTTGQLNIDASHSHTFSGNTSSTGSGSSFENRPPYYALAYIMKT
jgi:microcystin-dependent protein